MFNDRFEAGDKLAQKLSEELYLENLSNTAILAIPRGGVLVGSKLKEKFRIPLDVLIIKKIPSPQSDDLTIGAVGEGGVVVWEDSLIKKLNIPIKYRQEIVKEKIEEFEKKERELRGKDVAFDLKRKTVILVDDGISSGATMKAAVLVVKTYNPAEIIVAVPVIAAEVLEDFKKMVDRVVYLESPELFFSLEEHYRDFHQPKDEEIIELLNK